MDILVILQTKMSAKVKKYYLKVFCLFYNNIACSNQCITCTDAGSTVCASCKLESPVR